MLIATCKLVTSKGVINPGDYVPSDLPDHEAARIKSAGGTMVGGAGTAADNAAPERRKPKAKVEQHEAP